MGHETSKCYVARQNRGDFKNYLNGSGIDIGCGFDVLRVPEGEVRGWDKQQGDAQLLKTIEDNSMDFVYSSHCLEHLVSVPISLRNWFRVLKPGKFLYFVVPDWTLYEKERWPSRFNGDHKQSFSLTKTREEVKRPTHWHIPTDLTTEISQYGSLIAAFIEDAGYDYSKPSIDQTRGSALSQICVIARKKE